MSKTKVENWKACLNNHINTHTLSKSNTKDPMILHVCNKYACYPWEETFKSSTCVEADGVLSYKANRINGIQRKKGMRLIKEQPNPDHNHLKTTALLAGLGLDQTQLCVCFRVHMYLLLWRTSDCCLYHPLSCRLWNKQKQQRKNSCYKQELAFSESSRTGEVSTFKRPRFIKRTQTSINKGFQLFSSEIYTPVFYLHISIEGCVCWTVAVMLTATDMQWTATSS